MTAERWGQIESLYQSAADQPTEQRASFLDAHCADAELRREVEALLACGKHSGERLQAAVQGIAADYVERTTTGSGRRIGAYRIQQELGQGGMGAVYLAVRADDQFEKQVAIKLLKRGMDTEAMLQRFRLERQLLAGLQHPHIATLLDGGATPNGLPYFVMEYVVGQPVTAYCAERQLPVTERLQLFRSICAAVHYAHQNLIVHRDLKPGNILVTPEGAPKLLDFGVAKLLSGGGAPAQTIAGLPGSFLTPEYASPEQVRGEAATTATDIYSLGAILFEMLTGERPHRLSTHSAEEVERVICREEVERPSTVRRRVHGRGASVSADLDNIVLMAMQKDSRRRYGSVEQLSEDIERYLEGRPVRARAATWRYRSGKFIRRNRWEVAAASLLLLSILGGVAVAGYQARRAERRFQQVRKLANSFLFEFHDAIAQLPGSLQARQLVVKTALEYLDSLAQESEDDPALMQELATAYAKVGDVQGSPLISNLGDLKGALHSYNKAAGILRQFAGNPLLAGTRADLMLRLMTANSAAGNQQEAVAQGLEAIGLYEQLLLAHPDDPQRLRRVAAAHNDLALTYSSLRHTREALDHSTRALTLQQQLLAGHPRDAEGRSDLAASYSMQGRLHHRLEHLEEARDNYAKALALRQALVNDTPESVPLRRNLMLAHGHLGDVLGSPLFTNLGDRQGTLLQYRAMLAVAHALAIEDPADKRAQSDYAVSLMRAGSVEEDARAFPLYRSALEILEKLAAANPGNLQTPGEISNVRIRLGDRLAQREPRLALLEYRLAAARDEAIIAADPKEMVARRRHVSTLGKQTRLLVRTGQSGAALTLGRRAAQLAEELAEGMEQNPQVSVLVPEAHSTLGDVYTALSAAPEPRQERRRHLTLAREAYERSLQEWRALETRGLLTRTRAAEPERAAARLRIAETALAELK